MKVDGQKVETRKAFGAFLAIDVGAGDHVIDFSYFPEGLKPGRPDHRRIDRDPDLFMVFAQRDGEAESQGRGKKNLENAEKT